MVTLRRILRSGFLNFWRNAFISSTSILVMVVTLCFIGSLMFLSAILATSLDGIRGQVDLWVTFVSDAPEEEIMSIKDRLESMPEISQVTYTSREGVLKEFVERHRDDQIILQTLDELGDNPLGASLTIQAHDPAHYEDIAELLEEDMLLGTGSGIIDRVNFRDNQLAIERLTKLINSLERFGLIITVALAFVSVLITFNTIRLTIYTSREEIAVMRLVGASTEYIRGPFVVSGIIYGAISGIIALALFYPITFWIGDLTENFFIGLNVFDYYLENFLQIMLLIIISGIFIGGISSYLAVKRYLRV